ncbi:hypothetical protein [Desulfofundulus sp.]
MQQVAGASALSDFDRMREKVERLQAEARAGSMFSSSRRSSFSFGKIRR